MLVNGNRQSRPRTKYRIVLSVDRFASNDRFDSKCSCALPRHGGASCHRNEKLGIKGHSQNQENAKDASSASAGSKGSRLAEIYTEVLLFSKTTVRKPGSSRVERDAARGPARPGHPDEGSRRLPVGGQSWQGLWILRGLPFCRTACARRRP